jgi:hypothetical protein
MAQVNISYSTSPSKKETTDSNYKTELCKTWVEKNFCPYKEKCRFAHGKSDIHKKVVNIKNYKQKECNSFHNKGFCPYGTRCHFKHYDRKMKDIDRPYYNLLINSQKFVEILESTLIESPSRAGRNLYITNNIQNNLHNKIQIQDDNFIQNCGHKLKVFREILEPNDKNIEFIKKLSSVKSSYIRPFKKSGKNKSKFNIITSCYDYFLNEFKN